MTFTVIPIRSFQGMSRMATVLDADARRQLMARLAAHTVAISLAAGSSVTTVTGDPKVSAWAQGLGIAVIPEPEGGGLDAAARAGVEAAKGRRWLILHADLPLLEPNDITAVVEAARDGFALAPSHDGGTSAVVGTTSDFPFRYGPGSFQRHLAAVAGRATVVNRPGFGADVDQPSDLDWLRVLDTAVR
jgi:2-phospho-L-lactate guanylyltransferase